MKATVCEDKVHDSDFASDVKRNKCKSLMCSFQHTVVQLQKKKNKLEQTNKVLKIINTICVLLLDKWWEHVFYWHECLDVLGSSSERYPDHNFFIAKK